MLLGCYMYILARNRNTVNWMEEDNLSRQHPVRVLGGCRTLYIRYKRIYGATVSLKVNTLQNARHFLQLDFSNQAFEMWQGDSLTGKDSLVLSTSGHKSFTLCAFLWKGITGEMWKYASSFHSCATLLLKCQLLSQHVLYSDILMQKRGIESFLSLPRLSRFSSALILSFPLIRVSWGLIFYSLVQSIMYLSKRSQCIELWTAYNPGQQYLPIWPFFCQHGQMIKYILYVQSFCLEGHSYPKKPNWL